MLYSLNLYFLWFVIYSVIGWIYESIYCSIDNRRWMNRGFLNGPYCPIYGSGAILNLLILRPDMHPAVIFLSAVVLTGSLEYFTSFLMEVLFDARWWDYSDKRFHLNGRVFLLGLLAFGSFSLILLLYLHPLVFGLTSKLSYEALAIIDLILFTVILSDTIFTLTKLVEFKEYLRLAQEGIDSALVSVKNMYNKAEEKISCSVQRLNPQIKRMLLSFPKLNSRKYSGIIFRIREKLSHERELLLQKKRELLNKKK